MRQLLLFICLISSALSAQKTLIFDKRNIECEDKWVAYEKDENNFYRFGFIYIDQQAGLTFSYEGRFRINAEGTYVTDKSDDMVNVKVRLEPDEKKLAIIPESRFRELNIPRLPDWLKYYKENEGTVAQLHRWGYYYNTWEMYAKALTYLERAKKIDIKYPGLEFELAFAYNASSQFDKAIKILIPALQTSPTNCLLHKELVFAQSHLQQLDKAEKAYNTAINACDDKTMKAEMAFNLAYTYFENKDKSAFRKWFEETKKWSAPEDAYQRYLAEMERQLDQ